MEKLEIFTDPDFTLEIDKSCILTFWEFNYTNVEIYDEEFEEIWNQLVGDDIAEGFQLDETLYADENREIETGYTLWTQFWERVQSQFNNHILLEVHDILDSNDELSEFWYCYLINTHKVAELLKEDFQADEDWIKQKFQVKRDQ